MYMKINAVSSNFRSKNKDGRVPPRPLGSCPHDRLILPRAARREQSGRWISTGQRGSEQPGRRGRGRKITRGSHYAHKDVKNEGRSGNVYENKGPNDTMTDNISGFCAWLHTILHKNARILQKPSSFCHLWSAGKRTGRSKIWKLWPVRFVYDLILFPLRELRGL